MSNIILLFGMRLGQIIGMYNLAPVEHEEMKCPQQFWSLD
jgi:hypothetical protein